MKRFAYAIFCTAALIWQSAALYAQSLESVLSPEKRKLFEYDLQRNEYESDKLSKSWISPIMLRYDRSYTTQFPGKTVRTDNFSVTIDQPIFRSGGIYNAVKYASQTRLANRAGIVLQKRLMIADAVRILFELRKNKLQQERLKYQIKNDEIDIRQKRDRYEAGVLDSSFLDQAILAKSRDETALLELRFARTELLQRFRLLSDKDPESFTLPRLTLVSKKTYTSHNLELQRQRYVERQKRYYSRMTLAKYLPSVSLNGRYSDGDLNPLWASAPIKERYYIYGIGVSMPLDINSYDDVQSARIEMLKAQTETIEKRKAVDEEYDWIVNALAILDKKIALAKKDVALYRNLYKVTANLAKAGEKTPLDAEVMRNTLHMRRLDKAIYEIDKQIKLLYLYVRTEHAI